MTEADCEGRMDLRALPIFTIDSAETVSYTHLDVYKRQVLSIPRKIKSKEVVRMGFQSNFLFQNISNVFSACLLYTSRCV